MIDAIDSMTIDCRTVDRSIDSSVDMTSQYDDRSIVSQSACSTVRSHTQSVDADYYVDHDRQSTLDTCESVDRQYDRAYSTCVRLVDCTD